jgi:hypothetical protein
MSIKTTNRERGLDITSETLPPLWHGEEMDFCLAVMALQSCE